MKKEINGVMQRLADFAESKGGFAEIGRKIDKHPSTFYNLIRRDALPSLGTLSEIAAAFPDLDLNYIIRGTESGSLEANELEKAKKEVDLMRAILEDKYLGKLLGEVKSSGCTGEASAFITANGKRRFLLSPGLTHRMYTRF